MNSRQRRKKEAEEFNRIRDLRKEYLKLRIKLFLEKGIRVVRNPLVASIKDLENAILKIQEIIGA